MLSNFIGKICNASNFDASLLASKFSIFASKIAANTRPTEVIDVDRIYGNGFLLLFRMVGKLFAYLFFYICRFVLNLIDLLEVIVNRLSGISKVDSYDINNDFNQNPIFRLLLNETVLKIVNILIGVAIVLLVIFVIFAIIKASYDAAANDQEGAKAPIFRRAGKSLFMFVLMPVFLVVFILSTNAILNSVNMAFKSANGSNKTLGGTIFVAASYNANRYRNYAKRGQRAPILFDFEDPLQNSSFNSYSTQELIGIYDSWTNASDIYSNFAYQSFSDFSDTVVYRNGKLYNKASFGGFENFVTTPEEYYVLADFIDYAVTNTIEYFIKPMDDDDIDWAAVRDKIGSAMYYSIINNMKFSIGYSDEYDIDRDGKRGSGDVDGYIKEYVNSTGAATTPIADAVAIAQMILALGDYDDNTFKVLERVPGYVNYVRWAAEMALDSSSGELLRVYELTKYTYNTILEQIQERGAQLCVQVDGQYFAVEKLTSEEIAANSGEYLYKCDTNNEASKVDRVSVDHKFIYDNGQEYLNKYGQAIILPKDKLSVKYKQVSWPEKLFNDLLIVFGDVFKSSIANTGGNWMDMETTPSQASIEDGTVYFPSAFIQPVGLIMAELFLGQRIENDPEVAAASSSFGAAYSEDVLNAIIKTVGGEENYALIKSQIQVFQIIFDNIMAAILDDAALLEGVTDYDESVSINTYKQYLSTIMMSEEFATYFGSIAKNIINYNYVLYEMTKDPIIPAFTKLGLDYSQYVKMCRDSLDSSTLSYMAINNYISNSFPCYDEDYDGSSVPNINDLSEYVSKDDEGEETNLDIEAYEGWPAPEKAAYCVRAAEESSYLGVDIEKYYNKLIQDRNAAYDSYCSFITTESSDLTKDRDLLFEGYNSCLERLNDCDAKIYSFYKFLLLSSFRDAISNQSRNSISITLNDNTYNVFLTLSTTQIAEYAFGNQLVGRNGLAGDFYESGTDLLYVEPYFTGVVKYSRNVETNMDAFSEPFGVLRDFVQSFGDVAIQLSSSNFVDMAYGAVETLIGEDFEHAFAEYIYSDLLPQFPGLLKGTGLVVFKDLGLNIDEKNLISWDIVSYNYNNYDVKYCYATESEGNWTECNGEKTNISFEKPSEKTLVQTFVEFWGMEYERSKVGFTYDIFEENGNAFAVIDDKIYPVENVFYSSIREDNSVILAASGFGIKYCDKTYLIDTLNETVRIGDQTYAISREDGTMFVDIGDDRCQAESIYYSNVDSDNSVTIERKNAFVIKFLNGRAYLIDTYSETVRIGTETVGKSLVDYRRDAAKLISRLETRPGETDLELKDRFLSLLYLMSAGVTEGAISTDTYSKLLIKRLAGEENRPEESLVGKEYTLNFDMAIKDENKGTVFVICEYDKSKEKYVPMLVTNNYGSIDEFKSYHTVNPYNSNEIIYYPIVARGVIDENGNPTAIRMKSDGTIEFYRDNIYIVDVSNMELSTYYQTIEDVRVSSSIVSAVVNGVTKLISGKSLTQMVVESVPKLSADANLHFAYGSERTTVGAIDNGRIAMSYNFKILSVELFYDVSDMNMIVLIFGTVMLFGALMVACIGLIQRIWDVVVLFMVSPPIIATLAIDEKRFERWRNKIVSSVLSVYGIIVGLNVFFILQPTISSMSVVDSSSPILQTGMGKMLGENFINYLFRIVFLLTAIGLIRRAPAMMEPFISGGEQDIFSKGEATQQNVRDVVDTAKDHMSGQFTMDQIEKLKGTAKSFIPGYGFYKAKKDAKEKKKQKDIEKADERLIKSVKDSALARGINKDVVDEAISNLTQAYSDLREKEKDEKDREKKERKEREEQRAKRMKVNNKDES